MARLTCPRGHQWEAVANPARSRDTQQLCPVCGGAPMAQVVASRGGGTLAVQATLPQGVAVVPAVARRPTVAGYEILDELGRGGMGIVYKARHTALKRLVALKMVLGGAEAGPREVARFKTEAEAVARLQHPNIVQIYEVGDHEGRPFCALEYVAGGSLAQHLAGKPMPAECAAPLLADLATGIQHAHEHGIIHRDLKPANILLVSGGVVSGEWSRQGASDTRTTHHSPLTTHQPKITDFGLAKQLDNPTGQTKSGAVLGTPSYMAPEQAMGRNNAITPATDVWALGAIFYECLTGRPPFRAETSLDTMLQVATEEPVPPTRINREVPRDLETICLKCLRKEPEKRYASVRDLADDLHRFVRHEPIRARPVGVIERAARWAWRRPGLAATALPAIVPLLVAVIVWQWREPRPTEAPVPGQDQRSNESGSRNDYALLIAKADQECLASNFHRANQILDECPAELRNWEWDYLRRLSNWGVRRSLTGFRGGVRQVAFGKNRRLAVIAFDAPGVQVCDASTARRLLTLGEKSGKVHAVAFSPDGRFLAAAGEDRELHVYEVDNGKEMYHRSHTSPIFCVAYSPKGDVLAAGGGRPEEAGELRFWKADKGEALGEVRGLKARIESLAFDAGGMWINAVSLKDGLASFTVPQGQVLGEFPGTMSMYRRLVFNPEGSRISALSITSPGHIDSGTVPVKMWDHECRDLPEGGAALNMNGQAMTSPDARPGGMIFDAAFSPNGKFAALTGGWPAQGKVRLWRGSDRKDSITLLGHAKQGTSVSFAPDSDSVATGSGDGTVLIWDPTVRRYHTPLESRPAISLPPLGLAFSPDGRFLATRDEDASIALAVWDLHSGRKVACPRQGPSIPTTFCFSADGRQVAGVGSNGDRTVTVWDATTGQRVGGFADNPFSGGELGPVAGGFRLASGLPAPGSNIPPGLPTGLRLIDPLTGKADLAVDKLSYWLPFPAMSSDGRRLAAISEKEKVLTLWDTTTGKELLAERGRIGTAHFSADNRFLIFVDSSKRGTVWDAGTGKPTNLRLPSQPWHELAQLSADGKRLALPLADGTVLIWDITAGKEVATVRGHDTRLASVALSARGDRLFTATGDDSAVKVWDTSTGQELLSLRHARGGVVRIMLSPDGRRLATQGTEGARVWDATPLLEGVVSK